MQSSSATDTVSNSQEQDQQLRAQVELLRNPPEGEGASSSTAEETREPSNTSQSPPQPSNGYDVQPAASRDAARATNRGSRSEAESFIHPDLRAVHGQSPASNMMPIAPTSGHSPGSSNHSVPSISPNAPPAQPPNTNLAPAPPPASTGQEPAFDGRSKAKRELSQSKRAAQNRAAQRAFRQRKESYIKQLEQENAAFREMDKSFKSMQSENYALREYVLTLQTRLFDTQGEYPPPPPNVNLSQPAPEPRMEHEQEPGSTNHMNTGTPLEAVARAVAGLAAQEQMNQSHQQYTNDQEMKDEGAEDTRTAEEINRHLQPGEGEREQSD